MSRLKLKKLRSKSGLERMTVRVWQEDLNYMRENFPDNYNAQIRRIIADWVWEAKRNECKKG